MSGQIDTAAVVLAWCLAHNATIGYRDGAVTIRVGRVSRRGATLVDAWREAVDATAGRWSVRRRSRQMELAL